MTRFSFVLSLLLSALPIAAQSLAGRATDSLVANHHITIIGNGSTEPEDVDDDAAQMISRYYYQQFRHTQDPAAPYFLFMSKSGDMMMGVGGTVRMRGWLDCHNPINSNAFMPILIPMTPDPATPHRLGSTPAGTALYFLVLGNNDLLGKFQLYIEANFNGYNNRDFLLKKAYAIVRDFTIGYAPTSFSDPAAEPSIVDAAGANNKLSRTSVLVRYMPTFAGKYVVGISAEMPESYIAADSHLTATSSEYLPDIAAFVQYQWSKKQHIRLGGIIRQLPYQDLVSNQNRNVAGIGVMLSAVANPTKAITTYLNANYGKGYAGLGGDLLVGAYDLIPNPDIDGQMYAPRSFGWCLGVQYNFRPNLFATVVASQTRLLPDHSIASDEYKYGLFGAVNVFWNPLPRFQIGAELDLGKRVNFSGEHQTSTRIGLMAQVMF